MPNPLIFLQNAEFKNFRLIKCKYNNTILLNFSAILLDSEVNFIKYWLYHFKYNYAILLSYKKVIVFYKSGK